jgi:hypothetical protein
MTELPKGVSSLPSYPQFIIKGDVTRVAYVVSGQNWGDIFPTSFSLMSTPGLIFKIFDKWQQP